MPRPVVVVVFVVFAVLVTALAGCMPLPSKHATHAGPIWSQPGSPTTFKWSERETTSRMWGLDVGKHEDISFDTSESTRTDRTWITAIDARTNTTTMLSPVRAKVSPFYWDAARGVLWVYDDKRSALGLTAKDPIHAPGGIDVHVTALPAPWLVGTDMRTTHIFNARTNTTFALPAARPGHGYGEPYVDGDILRFVRTEQTDGVVAVSQTVIDWSGPQPVRLPDVVWTTPALPDEDGKRGAFAVMPDGRHFVEVVTTGTTNVYIYDMVHGGPVTKLPVAAYDVDTKASLVPLAGDVVYFLTAASPCHKGYLIATERKLIRPIDDAVCIHSFDGSAGRRYFEVGQHGAYVDGSLAVIDLGVPLKDALPVDATTLAYTRPDPDTKGVIVEKLDLATGTVTPLGTHANADDRLVGMYDDTLVFTGSGNTLVTERFGTASSSTTTPTTPTTRTMALPAAITEGPEGQPLAYETAGIGNEVERTKLWIDAVGGVTTTGKGAFGATIGLQRFWTDRLALSASLFARDEADAAYRTTDFGGAVGVAAFASHTRTGWFAGADLGLAQSTTRDQSIMDVDASIVDVRWAPSASLRGGYKGTLFGFDVAAVAPSLVDRDRGVMLMAGLSIGLFGVNR